MIGNEKGKRGEDFAAEYLIKQGYKILERNFHSRYGEIDIIAQNDDYIVFVEVKARQYNSMISGREAVNFSKQRKIVKTSVLYLQEHYFDLQPRYDVIEISLSKQRICGIEHIESAFNTQDMF